jgi:hypothetical protein
MCKHVGAPVFLACFYSNALIVGDCLKVWVRGVRREGRRGSVHFVQYYLWTCIMFQVYGVSNEVKCLHVID